MKKTKKLLSCVLAMIMALLSVGSLPISAADIDEHTHVPSETGGCTVCGLNILGLLNQAYIYSFPLVLMDVTAEKTSNTETATYTQAPINQFVHVPVFANATSKDVVLPNVDTLYSQAFLDLNETPVIMELPETDRFCIMQLMDAYSNTVDIVECMYQEGRKTYIITGPDFSGIIPKDMIEIECPTNMAWILGRTVCGDNENNDADDWFITATIQYQMKMYTPEQYNNGTIDTPAKGEVEEEYKDIVPLDYVIYNLTAEEFFDRANALMAENPPAEADAAFIANLAAVGVGPGFDFDCAALGGEGAVELMYGWIRLNIVNNCIAASAEYRNTNGCWGYYGDPIGDYGTAYAFRCLIALGGFGANPTDMAIYPTASTDSNGVTLSGKNSYIIHITAEQLELLNKNDGYGFWSITAYGIDQYLIANDENRYCINDRNAVVNDDGSIDIYVCAEAPSDSEKYPNRIPVDQDDFQLCFRIYLPCEEISTNNWIMPRIDVVTVDEPVNPETGDMSYVYVCLMFVAFIGIGVILGKSRRFRATPHNS